MNNQKYDIVLLDADETIFDFIKSEAYAIEKTLETFSLPFSQEILSRYSAINLSLWKALERGEVTRERLKTLRFEMLFDEMGVTGVDTKLVNLTYLNNLSMCGFLLDGAYDFVKKLSEYCKIYIATNGLTIAQRGRLSRSEIKDYVNGIFISEEIGFSKPDKEYFEHIFSELNIEDKSRIIILGDSQTSDMQGGTNGGIDTCLYNPNNGEFNPKLCKFVINSYDEFFDILFQR